MTNLLDDERDCFAEPIPEIFEAAELLSDAVDAHLRGDLQEAAQLIRQADIPTIGEWLDEIWLGANTPIRGIRKVDGLPPILPKDQRHVPRDAPRQMKKELVARDGHHCRFCSMPLVRPEVRKELTRLYPQEARWTSTRARDQHRGLQVLWLQYDHVIVHSRGGETSLDNIVVACAACNYGRDRYMLAEVGFRDPTTHVRMPSWSGWHEWDGLERLLPKDKRYAQDAGSPFRHLIA
ncbi:MAG: HNH endonuclease [Verrucomicrobiaceae bacterium]|nr:MAG: HNH endonuclease [Verrucomicrobiaceae bacterium]